MAYSQQVSQDREIKSITGLKFVSCGNGNSIPVPVQSLQSSNCKDNGWNAQVLLS